MYFKKIIFVFLLIFLSVTLLTACKRRIRIRINSGSHFLKEEDAMEFLIKKTATEPIKTIDIETRIADIEIIQSDGYYVEIDYLYWEHEPEYTLKDGKLTFNDDKALPETYSINFNLDNIIRIYIPQDAQLDKISLQSSSGNISISGFVAENLKTALSYGDLSMKNCAAARAEVHLSSGNSIISDFQCGELDYSNSYGNLLLSNANSGESKLPADIPFDKINISMSSGNARLKNIYARELKISNSYGNIDCAGITADSFNSRLSSGDLDIDKSDIKQLTLNNSYGNITLNLLGKETDYSLNLITSYGEITVNDKSYDNRFSSDNEKDRRISAELSSGDLKLTFNDK